MCDGFWPGIIRTDLTRALCLISARLPCNLFASFYSHNECDTLRALSCIVRNRFLSVGSQYGITACTISKCGIKDAMWQSFSSTTL